MLTARVHFINYLLFRTVGARRSLIANRGRRADALAPGSFTAAPLIGLISALPAVREKTTNDFSHNLGSERAPVNQLNLASVRRRSLRSHTECARVDLPLAARSRY